MSRAHLQDGSSPYLAKSGDAQVTSGTALRSTGKVFGSSIPGVKSLAVPASKGTVVISPRTVPVAPTASRVPTAGVSPEGRGPSDPPPSVKVAAGAAFPTVREGSISGPPAVKQVPGRVDPATYLAEEVSDARETVLAAQQAMLTAVKTPPSSTPVPIKSFALSDLSDDEEEPQTPRKPDGATPVLAALGLFAAAAESLSPFWKVLSH
jgi:hypothetical protein